MPLVLLSFLYLAEMGLKTWLIFFDNAVTDCYCSFCTFSTFLIASCTRTYYLSVK